MYMDKDFIGKNLYQLIDKFNERKSKINYRDFYFALLIIYIHFIMEMEELVRSYLQFIFLKKCIASFYTF